MKNLSMLAIAAVLLMAPAAPDAKSRSWFSPIRSQASPGAGVVLIPDFRVFNDAYTCADSFANVQASLVGRRLMLSYRPIRPDTTVLPCLPSPIDHGPTFRLPMLGPGYYEIHEQVSTCPPDAPLCEQPAPTYLGLLAVGDMFSHWDMQPDTVDAGQPFPLKIVNPAYGNCFVGFTDTGLVLARTGPITLIYTVEYFPSRLCLADIPPHGPTFSLSGLPDGRHSVGIQERPECMRDSLPCKPMAVPSSIIDTLIVRRSTGIGSRTDPGPRLLESALPGLKRGYRLDGRKAARPGKPAAAAARRSGGTGSSRQ